MNASFLLSALVAACLALVSSVAQADGLALERHSWADPELSGLRLRLSPLQGGGLSVLARASDRQGAERARQWLASEPEVEHFQVEVDPRIHGRADGPSTAMALEDAVAAIRADAGTRPHLKLLESAFFDERSVLRVETSEPIDPAAERRLARLLLAQPGIAGVWIGREPALESRRPRRQRAPATREQAPTGGVQRTRIHLDPLQPEAANIESQEPSPRTLLHVGLLEPAAAAAAVEETEPATPTASSTSPQELRIDRVIEDLLAEAMLLEGAPKTLKARVRSGVVVFGGQVASREFAVKLRELARNFDGVRRVTGGLMVTATGQTIPMDALPD